MMADSDCTFWPLQQRNGHILVKNENTKNLQYLIYLQSVISCQWDQSRHEPTVINIYLKLIRQIPAVTKLKAVIDKYQQLPKRTSGLIR